MKERASDQKTPSSAAQENNLGVAAGAKGVALAPPTAGAATFDQPPLQLTADVQTPNKTGLPDELKAGVERLSGLAMDDVRVHYNSARPARLQALAYTQGTEIHVAPGQARCLPHEAWHVVQQLQGRVKPTLQMKGGVPVNDDQELEREADEMGAKAAAPGRADPASQPLFQRPHGSGAVHAPFVQAQPIVQRVLYIEDEEVKVDPTRTEMDEEWEPIEAHTPQVWIKKDAGNRAQIEAFLKTDKGKRRIALARLEAAAAQTVPDEADYDRFEADEFEKLVRESSRLPPDLRNVEGYVEVEGGSGTGEKKSGQYKTGFAREAGFAILRDTFKAPGAIDFFPSDAFLAHLRAATDQQGAPANQVLPDFPQRIYIPQLLNNKTNVEAIAALEKNKGEEPVTGANPIRVIDGDASWGALMATPLVSLVGRIIAGYTLIRPDANQLHIEAIGAYYYDEVNRLASLIIEIGR